MNNLEKITIRKNWYVAKNNNISIVGATYREALSYLVALRTVFHFDETLLKPVSTKDE